MYKRECTARNRCYFDLIIIDRPRITATPRQYRPLTQAQLSPLTAWLVICIGRAYRDHFQAAEENTSEACNCEMSDLIYQNIKPMPPLEELAKKREPQVDHIGSGAPKAEQNKAYEKNEGHTTKYIGLGARVKPRPKKARVRAPKNHPEQVESSLQEYEEDAAEQEEEEDTKDYSGLGGRSKRLPRKRSLQESKPSHLDDSESGASRAEGSRRNVQYAGGQLSAKVTGSIPKKAPARESDSKLGRGKIRGKGPFMGAQEPGAGNRDTPEVVVEFWNTRWQEPIESWVTGNEGNSFECFEQWDFGDEGET